MTLLYLHSQSQANYIYKGATSHSHISSHPRGQAKSVNQRPPPDYSNSSRIQHFDKNVYVWRMWIHNTFSQSHWWVLRDILCQKDTGQCIKPEVSVSLGIKFQILTCFFQGDDFERVWRSLLSDIREFVFSTLEASFAFDSYISLWISL